MRFKNLTAGIATGLAVLMLAGCGGIDESATAVTINGGEETINMGYANFFAKINQSDVDSYYGSYYGSDTNYWNEQFSGEETMSEYYKNIFMDYIEEFYLSKKHADEYGITVSDEELLAINEAADKFMADNSDKTLSTLGATRDYVVEYLTNRTFYQKMLKQLQDEAEVVITDDEANRSSVSYVLFNTNDYEEGDPAIDELKAQAEQLAAAADFEATAEELGVTVQTYTYTTAADPAEDYTIGEEAVKAAKELSDGEVSGVISGNAGFYVIRMDKTFDPEATERNRESLDAQKRNEHYNEVMDTWKEEIEWTVNDNEWNKIQFSVLFKPVETAE